MNNLDDIFIFVLIVDCGSFTAAAEKLGVSHSSISKRMSRLEKELGTQLLYRSTRSLSMTSAGDIIYSAAKNADNEIQNALGNIQKFQDEPSGTINLSAPSISTDLVVADCINAFCKKYKNVSVNLSVSNTMVDIIRGGYDLVIRSGVLPDSELIAKPLAYSQWLVCASKNYLEKHGTPKRPSDLKIHNCMSYTPQETGALQWAFEHPSSGTERVRVNGKLHTDDLRTLRKAVLADAGLIYVPRCLIYKELEEGVIEQVLPEYTTKGINIYAIYQKNIRSDNKIRALLTMLTEAYQAKHLYFSDEAYY